jgi:hypothetical protein
VYVKVAAVGSDPAQQPFIDVLSRIVPGQLFVHYVAQTALYPATGRSARPAAVADQVFQPAHQHGLEKHHWVEGGWSASALPLLTVAAQPGSHVNEHSSDRAMCHELARGWEAERPAGTTEITR